MITPIHANSRDVGEVYRLLNMIHVMAGMLANTPSKSFQLARTNSNPDFGPILTVWTNGIVDIEARTWASLEADHHEYTIKPCAKESE